MAETTLTWAKRQAKTLGLEPKDITKEFVTSFKNRSDLIRYLKRASLSLSEDD